LRAASATFALKAGVWFRRGRLFIVSPDSRGTACPLSGRNSTYRPVQILEASSAFVAGWAASDTQARVTPVADIVGGTGSPAGRRHRRSGRPSEAILVPFFLDIKKPKKGRTVYPPNRTEYKPNRTEYKIVQSIFDELLPLIYLVSSCLVVVLALFVAAIFFMEIVGNYVGAAGKMRAEAIGKRALFPISVSNQAFSTRRVLPALQAVLSSHAEVVIFIADHLQVYNKALQIADGAGLSKIIGEFGLKQDYREQRSKWIQRMTSRMPGCEASHWKLIGVDDITDFKCFNIFRNVMVAYYSVCCFQDDVNRTAKYYAQSRYPQYPLEICEQLSRGYLLEEIALNVRLHIIDGIDDEYYMEEQFGVLVNLYNSKYGFNAFDLANVRSDGRKIRFFGCDENDCASWSEQLPEA
jgi:hypothetical protein